MSEWALKRFWKDVDVVAVDGGYTVTLDARNVRTPGKALLVMPSEVMAFRVAAEWQAQEDRVDPRQMPWTRSANSAIDKLSVQRIEVEDHLIGYAGTDLLCYRAERPETLVERQKQNWDPILDWAVNYAGVRMKTTSGVMPVAQNPADLEVLRDVMSPLSDFAITGFHDLVILSGSYLLAMAVAAKKLNETEAWGLSRVDEEWQIEQWGRDEEADLQSEIKRDAFFHAAEFFRTA